MITQALLHELFHYDPETGVFTRRVRSGKCHAGTIAGGVRKDGYVRICVNAKKEYAHHLAWLYIYGEWPSQYIDHIDGNPSNNRIANLRLATASQNQQNRFVCQCNNKTGFIGVSREDNGFRAIISDHGRQLRIGKFKTPEEAAEAYLRAKRKLHEFCTI